MPVKLATAVFASIAFVIAPLAMDVAFPTEVTGPAKFALVITVLAVVAVVALVAVAALPVMLPAIGLVTVKLVKVPTLVKLDPVTVDFKVVPVNCSAATAAEILMSPLPSNATPFIFLAVANLVAVPAVVALVAVAALPVMLPAIGLVTVKLVKVPTLVKLDPVTVDFRLVPVNVPASAGTVIFPVPSNATPFIFLAVANLVAVPALPETVV